MHNRRIIKNYNLLEISFEEALTLAFESASEAERRITGHPLTYAKLAVRCGKASSTMHRYFTDPEYNPPTHFLPTLCKGLNNRILVEWLTVHSGGCFVPLESDGGEHADIFDDVRELNSETTEAVNALMDSMKDGRSTKEEISAIRKELTDVVAQANKAIMSLDAVKG